VTDSRSGTVGEVIQYCKEGSTSFEKTTDSRYPITSPPLGFPEPLNTADSLHHNQHGNPGTFHLGDRRLEPSGTRDGTSAWVKVGSTGASVAILCRRLGKSLAVIAGLGILVISFPQPLAVFDNCWCSTTTLNAPRQLVVFYTEGFALEWGVVKVWIGCLVLAFCTSLFGFSIFLGSLRAR